MTPEERAKEILRRSYRWLLVPAENGGFTGEIVEFPGCVVEGDSAVDAATELEGVALAWLEDAIKQGLPIPEPTGGVE